MRKIRQKIHRAVFSARPIVRHPLAVALVLLVVVCVAPLSAQEEWYMGKPIADFAFIGLDTVSENELVPIVRRYIGVEFSLDIFWEIQETLYALDYFESIEANARPGDETRESVIVEFTVKEKPSVEDVVLEGNKRLRKGEILDNVLVKKGDLVTETAANLDAQAIIDLYLEKGYTEVSVVANLEPGEEENTVIVKFIIDEGVQTAIRSIVFSGNEFASESTLRRQMKTKPQSLFSSGVFQEIKFEEDMQRIVDYYFERGYIDANIVNVERNLERDEEEEKNFLNITIYIEEGLQWTYGGMDFEGNHIFTDETLRELVRQIPGKTLDKLRLEADTQRVADLYYENGYIFNVINREEKRDEEKQEISFTIRIVEKDRAHIENIIVKGNEKTKDYVIYRELPFEEGDIFSKTKVLQGLQNLYNLQYFTAIQPETPPGSAEGLMDLVINVEEGSTANINFGVMFSGGSYPISGMVKWEENNFLGKGQKLGVNAELSTQRQLISLSFEEPWLLGYRWLGGVSFSFEHAVVPDVKTDSMFPRFNGDEEEAFPDPFLTYEDYQNADYIPEGYLAEYDLWKFSLGFNTGYRYFTPLGWLGVRSGISTSLEQIKYDESIYPRPFDPTVREGDDVWKNVNKLGVTLFWDKRDFFLNPSTGFYIAQGVTFAYGLPPGTREYTRTDTTVEGFLTLFDVPATDTWNFKMVLAAHTSLSFIFPPFWELRKGQDIAITNDLLYVDGWNIARGWPLETDRKVLWDNRLELRMPISEQLLWWVFFFDGVVAYPEISDMRGLSLDDLYFSIGGGLRFTIPQFPIRLYLVKRFQVEQCRYVDQPGDLKFFERKDGTYGLTLDFVISLGGDTF